MQLLSKLIKPIYFFFVLYFFNSLMRRVLTIKMKVSEIKSASTLKMESILYMGT